MQRQMGQGIKGQRGLRGTDYNVSNKKAKDFTDGLVAENLHCNARDTGSIPGQGSKISCHRAAKPEFCNY